MGRREQRGELQATWSVYEAETRGVPFTTQGLKACNEARRSGPYVLASDTSAEPERDDRLSRLLPRTLIARLGR